MLMRIYVNRAYKFHDAGYTIPAGWVVMISPMSVHLNPDIFEDPLTFNPWRWQVITAKCLININYAIHLNDIQKPNRIFMDVDHIINKRIV